EISGDVDMEALLQQGGERRFFGMSDQRYEEDEPVSGVVGLGLMFNDTWGIRAEGQFGGQESYSGGLTYFF
ncbi:MAG: hypothetical protein D3904_07905, partial [Candidatus Electrothrix sp. EH2]|nr:hypothetical protein [Candidatus Electrothrix sp. EH2]